MSNYQRTSKKTSINTVIGIIPNYSMPFLLMKDKLFVFFHQKFLILKSFFQKLHVQSRFEMIRDPYQVKKIKIHTLIFYIFSRSRHAQFSTILISCSTNFICLILWFIYLVKFRHHIKVLKFSLRDLIV